MNYIRHLNATFQRFSKDPRLNTTHISLYMALFQFWNMNHFTSIFYVHREEVMKMSKIGSKVTYHRCLKNLDHWNYITYLPSHNPYKSSQVKMHIFCTGNDTTSVPGDEQATGRAVIPLVKDSKQKKKNYKPDNQPTRQNVFDYFDQKKWPALEAEKFYNHYSSLGWRTSGKAYIIDWRSLAKNWIIKAKEFQTASGFKDHLKTIKNKDYDQPL